MMCSKMCTFRVCNWRTAKIIPRGSPVDRLRCRPSVSMDAHDTRTGGGGSTMAPRRALHIVSACFVLAFCAYNGTQNLYVPAAAPAGPTREEASIDILRLAVRHIHASAAQTKDLLRLCPCLPRWTRAAPSLRLLTLTPRPAPARCAILTLPSCVPLLRPPWRATRCGAALAPSERMSSIVTAPGLGSASVGAIYGALVVSSGKCQHAGSFARMHRMSVSALLPKRMPCKRSADT